MNFIKKISIIILTILLVFTLVNGAAFAQEKIIKIGTLFPLTGSCALAGSRCKAAVEIRSRGN